MKNIIVCFSLVVLLFIGCSDSSFPENDGQFSPFAPSGNIIDPLTANIEEVITELNELNYLNARKIYEETIQGNVKRESTFNLRLKSFLEEKVLVDWNYDKMGMAEIYDLLYCVSLSEIADEDDLNEVYEKLENLRSSKEQYNMGYAIQNADSLLSYQLFMTVSPYDSLYESAQELGKQQLALYKEQLFDEVDLNDNDGYFEEAYVLLQQNKKYFENDPEFQTRYEDHIRNTHPSGAFIFDQVVCYDGRSVNHTQEKLLGVTIRFFGDTALLISQDERTVQLELQLEVQSDDTIRLTSPELTDYDAVVIVYGDNKITLQLFRKNHDNDKCGVSGRKA